MKIQFTFDGEPVPQSRPRFSRGRAYEDSRSKAFKAAVRAMAQAIIGNNPPLSEPVACVLKFYRRFKATARNFGDADNLAKGVMDALSGLAFVDDSQVTSLLIQKFQDRENPRVEVEITPV